SYCFGLCANTLDGSAVLHRAIGNCDSYNSHGFVSGFLVRAPAFRGQHTESSNAIGAPGIFCHVDLRFLPEFEYAHSGSSAPIRRAKTRIVQLVRSPSMPAKSH